MTTKSMANEKTNTSHPENVWRKPVAASGPYTNKAAKLKVSPIEKLACTDRIRNTVRPLTIASPAGISQARLIGDFTRVITDRTILAVPRTFTPQRYAAGLFM